MKIYPEADVSFYVEKPSCCHSYFKHGTTYSWKPPGKPFRPKEMPYWNDPVGAKMVEIKTKDLYFENWSKSRIRKEACLGMLYSTGNRFIKLTMAPPAGHKCAPLPVNLQMAHHVNSKCKYGKKSKVVLIYIQFQILELLKAKAKAERKARKKIKDEANAKKKAEKAYKNRTKKRGRS